MSLSPGHSWDSKLEDPAGILMWTGVSTTLCSDFQPLTVISDELRVVSDVFVKLSQMKNIVEEIKSIVGAHAEQSLPSWVCVFYRNHSLSILISGIQAHKDELRTGAHDGFSFYCSHRASNKLWFFLCSKAEQAVASDLRFQGTYVISA